LPWVEGIGSLRNQILAPDGRKFADVQLADRSVTVVDPLVNVAGIDDGYHELRV
jgi:hypothetical protein